MATTLRTSESGRPAHAFHAAQPEGPGELLRTWTGWGFLLCAVVAVGYGLGTLYGSGTRLATFDVTTVSGRTAETSIGPILLDPMMNPLRVVLHAAYAPVGSTRIHHETTLVDETGRELWRRSGALGSNGDEAFVVRSTASLGDFELTRTGHYSIRMRTDRGSMDDLRDASLELRRNVRRVDPRIPWGFGLAALGCLIANLIATRRRPSPHHIEHDEPRAAA